MADLKEIVTGTMEQALGETIDATTLYNLKDLFEMVTTTNAKMTTEYMHSGFYKKDAYVLCTDDGDYKKGVIYKFSGDEFIPFATIPEVIKGTTDPTTSTVGQVGQFYLNTATPQLFQCTAVSGSTYTWVQVGGGNYLSATNPTGTGSFSLNRNAGSTIGDYSFAEGYQTVASGSASHAEGNSTFASSNYSHAEGNHTIASGEYSHSEGSDTIASGEYSHSEGNSTTASSFASHAEGYYTTANGAYSHAEGNHTIASGNYSHAEGNNTSAQRQSQHTFGEYNILDTQGTTYTRGAYVEIVGNGTADNARSNARTLDWSGNEWLAGGLTMGANNNPVYPILSGSTAPTTSTAGEVGQQYVETTTPSLYYCSAKIAQGTTPETYTYTYTWTQAGGGGGIPIEGEW